MLFARLASFAVALSLSVGSFASAVKRDQCAQVDSDLLIDTFDILNVDYGHIGPVCLCLSQIPDLINTDTVLSIPAQILGAGPVYAAVGALIGASPACPAPSTRKRDTYVFTDRMCPKGLTLCGVQSSWSNTNWECIDTNTELESCGGCALGVMGTPGTGVDCTAIEGVEDVACNRSKCQVFSCAVGYRVSDCGTTCVSSHHT